MVSRETLAVVRDMWAYFRVAERLGRRAPIAQNVVKALRVVAFEDRSPTPADAAKKVLAAGRVGQTLWITKQLLFDVAKSVDFKSPDKNLLIEDNAFIWKVRDLARSELHAMFSAPDDAEEHVPFAAVFARDATDVVLLKELFDATPEALYFRGPLVIGWDYPPFIVWIGFGAQAAVWTEPPAIRAAALAHPPLWWHFTLPSWCEGEQPPRDLTRALLDADWRAAVMGSALQARSWHASENTGIGRRYTTSAATMLVAHATSREEVRAAIVELRDKAADMVTFIGTAGPEVIAEEVARYVGTTHQPTDCAIADDFALRRAAAHFPWLWHGGDNVIPGATGTIVSQNDLSIETQAGFVTFLECWRGVAPRARTQTIERCWRALAPVRQNWEPLRGAVDASDLLPQGAGPSALRLPRFLGCLYGTSLATWFERVTEWIVTHPEEIDDWPEVVCAIAKIPSADPLSSICNPLHAPVELSRATKRRYYLAVLEEFPKYVEALWQAGRLLIAEVDPHEGTRMVQEAIAYRPDLRYTIVHEALRATWRQPSDVVIFVLDALAPSEEQFCRFFRELIDFAGPNADAAVIAYCLRTRPEESFAVLSRGSGMREHFRAILARVEPESIPDETWRRFEAIRDQIDKAP